MLHRLKHKYKPSQTAVPISNNLQFVSCACAIIASIVIVPSCKRSEEEKRPIDQESTSLDLDTFQWKNRLVFIFAPSSTDHSYLNQKDGFEGKEDELNDRDIIVFELIETGPSMMGNKLLTNEQQSYLRHKFGIPAADYGFILLGKDGTVKLRAKEVVASSDLFDLIDRMPMRQEEIKRKAKQP
ncbi:MAG: DUF4174 domain-containing protein [Candidatus Hodarchaeota archaeon]